MKDKETAYFKLRMKLLSELKIQKLGENWWGTSNDDLLRMNTVLQEKFPLEHNQWLELLDKGEYRWEINKENC